MYYIGVDIGGTFTDLVLMDESGATKFYKSPTTPGELKVGVFDALKLVADDLGISTEKLLQQVAHFGHGTTQVTNALLQRKGVKTGLITTKGFADTIFIQRMMGLAAGLTDDEARHYSHRNAPDPIVPRNLLREVSERVDFAGTEVVPLNESEAVAAVRDLIGQGVEAIAVCFLWSFMNPGHEKAVKAIIQREAPQVFVSISSELLPVMGEYERTSATAMNAYLAPITATYIRDLTDSLRQPGLTGSFCIMNSSGGGTTASEAADTAVHLVSSGPVGGVLGSISLGKALGIENIVATDMGGTSFDVAVIADGKPIVATLSEIAKYHVSIPMVEVSSIGAGGGSIARAEDGEVKVGPQSAGAKPGPACYGKGGIFPTVTDADLVLGMIDPDYFLGGRIKLDRSKAERAISEYVADPLGLDVVQAAAALRRNGVKDDNMVFERTLGMLYRRQAHEIQVAVPWRRLGPSQTDELIKIFEKAYEDLYGKGTAYKEAGIEIRRFRIDAVGRLRKPALKEHKPGKADASPSLLGSRQVYFHEVSGFRPTKVYDGNRLSAGNVVPGPAVLQYPGTTVIVGPGQKGVIDRFLNCAIEVQ